jgi:hypothetical protein
MRSPGTGMPLAARALLAAAAASAAVCQTASLAFADDSKSSESRGSAFSLIDNSHADSWLEVDRTANSTIGSGTAGSDHDGGNEIRRVNSPGTTPDDVLGLLTGNSEN